MLAHASKLFEQTSEKQGLAAPNRTHSGRTCSYYFGGDAKNLWRVTREQLM